MQVVNSKQYSWNDISVAFGGKIEEGVTEVEYVIKQDQEYLRGRGNKPYGILKGNKDFEGKITVWQSTLESMVRDAPNKDILALSFDVIWAFTPLDGGETVIDILVGCAIKEYKKSMKQGDKNMLVELPFSFLDVKPQQ